MRILSLSVEHFKCVQKAQMNFCPGLNVLHGPNDLGKSSLVEAIRAVLLLQASSREHEAFVPWNGSGDPSVELVFESESQRIWRIRKTFASSGRAFLEESRNGVDFRIEARGRDVDGRLSELLRWGLAPPGGKGRPKGMPITFLSEALLADQERVAAILEQDLSGDSDESGKKRLIEVLQAIAEDPLFKSVLISVQAKVDEAFSSGGRKRIGKNSPWVQIRDTIRQAEEYVRQCHEQSQKTAAIEIELSLLNDRALEGRARLDKASETLEDVQANQKRQVLRQEVLGRLRECEKHISEIAEAFQQLKNAESVHQQLDQRVIEVSEQRQAASVALKDATDVSHAAKEELARLQSEDSARERLLRQTALEGRYSELRVEQEQTDAAIARIRSAEYATTRLRASEEECRKLTESISNVSQMRDESMNALQRAQEQDRTLSGIDGLFRVKAARLGIEEAEAGLARVESWLSEAEKKKAEAAAVEEAVAQLNSPSLAEIEHLRQLDRDLQLARARLSVGLYVQLLPRRPLKISVHRDDQEPTPHDLSGEAVEITASSKIRIDIDDVADLIFSGGDNAARIDVQHLSERWASEAEPLFKRLGAITIDDLVWIASEATERSHEAQKLRGEASQLEQRVADQRDWKDSLVQCQRNLVEAEKDLGTANAETLETAASGLGLKDIAETQSRLDSLRGEIKRLEETERKLEVKLNAEQATIAEKEKNVASLREELLQAEISLEGNWQDLLPAALDRQATIKVDLDAVSKELESLVAEADKSLIEAEAAADVAEKSRLSVEADLLKLVEDLQTAEKLQAKSEGELTILRETTAKLDHEAAQRAMEDVRAELEGIPEPPYEVTDKMLANAEHAVQALRSELSDIEDDIKAKRGALEHVGGAVARERTESAQEALKAAREREQEMEIDYAAWDLLRATLHEAEQEEGVHLGRVLGEPISKRFSDLTHRRYGTLTLGPHLETQEITSVGDGRLVTSLSVGTRDQLATVFRLSLAEQLQSVVILDDQLTQSDTRRMSWLRDLIRELSSKIQIVVFTCRPSDYLLPAELKSGKKSEPVTSLIRSINLEQVIERSG